MGKLRLWCSVVVLLTCLEDVGGYMVTSIVTCDTDVLFWSETDLAIKCSPHFHAAVGLSDR